jgi:hypothetical protein
MILYGKSVPTVLHPDSVQPKTPVFGNNMRRHHMFSVIRTRSDIMRKRKHKSTTPAPDPVVSDPLGAYALPPQATDGLVQQDIDPPVEC